MQENGPDWIRKLRARSSTTVRHGEIVREGWRNILELLIPLYRADLLPDDMTRVDDFVDLSGRIDITRQVEKHGEKHKAE